MGSFAKKLQLAGWLARVSVERREQRRAAYNGLRQMEESSSQDSGPYC